MKNPKLLLVVLLLVLAIIVFLNKKRDSTDKDIITLTCKNKSIKVSKKIIENMATDNITDRKGKIYRGVKVSVLTRLITKDKFTGLEFIAKDGASIKLKDEDIINAYIVFIGKEDAFYYRLAIPTDEFKQRWLKYIVSIKVIE